MDPEKKRIYDQVGEEGLKGGPGGGSGQGSPGGGFNFQGGFPGGGGGGGGGFRDPFDIFKNMFGDDRGGSTEFHFSSGGFNDQNGGANRRSGHRSSSSSSAGSGFPGGGGGFPGGGGGFPGGGGFESMFGGGRGRGGPTGRSSPEPLYGKNDGVTELKTSSYPKPTPSASKKNSYQQQLWLVHFDASSSGSDPEVREKFIKLCQLFTAQDIKCGSVNCEDQGALCKQKGVTDYPTFKLVTNKEEMVFDSQGSAVTMQALHSFVSDHIPSTVINLRTPSQMDDFVGKTLMDKKEAPKGVGIVLLTAKYDTSLLMKVIAYYFSGMVPVGEVRGSNEKIIAEFGLKVDNLPVMVVLCGNALKDKKAHVVIDSYDMKNVLSIKEVLLKFDKPSYYKDAHVCSKILADSTKTQKVRRKAMQDHLKLSEQQLKKMKTAELMDIINFFNFEKGGLLEKSDYVRAILNNKHTVKMEL